MQLKQVLIHEAADEGHRSQSSPRLARITPISLFFLLILPPPNPVEGKVPSSGNPSNSGFTIIGCEGNAGSTGERIGGDCEALEDEVFDDPFGRDGFLFFWSASNEFGLRVVGAGIGAGC